MPNEYRRKPTGANRATWSEEDLINAISQVKNNTLNFFQASKEFNIPYRTLRRRFFTGNTKKGRLGPDSLFKEKEKKIVNHIKKLQSCGFAPTINDLRQLAFQFAESLNLKHNFNKETGKAGYDWVKSFLRRNPEVALRKSEGVSLQRAKGMTREEVYNFFDLLESLFQEHDFIRHPNNVFNMDETGLQLNNKPSHVLAMKGSKSVPQLTSAEKGENISLICCCSAEGNFIPPVAIFKGKNKKDEYSDGMPPGSDVYMNEKSSYINTDLFFKWLKEHFYPRKPPGKVLLLLDGHTSHCNSIEMLEFCNSNDIILLCFPSHTTHYLQPLDRAFFKFLKSNFNNETNAWIRNNPSRKLGRIQFGGLLGKAWGKSANQNNGASGFRACGLFPPDRNAIPEYAFISDTAHTIVLSTDTVTAENPLPSTSGANIMPNPIPSTSGVNKENEENQSTGNNDVETPSKTLDKVYPVPSYGIIVSSKRKQHAEVLTSPENFEKIRNRTKIKDLKKEPKEQKRSKGKIPKKRPLSNRNYAKRIKKEIDFKSRNDNSDDLSIEDDHISLHDSSSEGDIEYEILGDICIVCGEYYHATKKKCDWLQCVLCQMWFHEDCSKDPAKCLTCNV